jgi:hypothetical protein
LINARGTSRCQDSGRALLGLHGIGEWAQSLNVAKAGDLIPHPILRTDRIECRTGFLQLNNGHIVQD